MKHKFSSLLSCVTVVAAIACGCAGCRKDTRQTVQPEPFPLNHAILGSYDTAHAVKCSNGIFVGRETDGILSFKGIPYAQQPVGTLRWKPVGVAADGDSVFEAYNFGKIAIQTGADPRLTQGEDCLSLNVWVNPADTATAKPVMVYIHGGSYGWGSSAEPMFNCTNFVRNHPEMVLVTINYRLGIYGFIDFSEVDGGEAYAESGNLGLLDQIVALQWVQRNIAAFGGNPDNVTVFGESAGAGSVSLLPLIPQSKGLFHRAIMESGSIALTYSRRECLPLAQRLLKATGATDMSELAALSPQALREANEGINRYNNFPERDGVVIPENLYAAYQNGGSSDVAMLMGTNAQESRFWIDKVGGINMFRLKIPVLFESNMKPVDKAVRDSVERFVDNYPLGRTWGISEFYTEAMFRLPALAMADSRVAHGATTYVYYWTRWSALPYMEACHAVELAYVFGNLDQTMYTGDNIYAPLSRQVQQMWVNFAKNGNPGLDSLQWLPYDTVTRPTMVLDTVSGMQFDPLGQQRVMLSGINAYHLNGNYLDMDYNVPIVYAYVAVVLAPVAIIAGLWALRRHRRRKTSRKQQ